MCLIVYMPAGKRANINDLEVARKSNRDGFGLMWHDAKSDTVTVVKNNVSTEKGFRSAYTNVPNDVPLVVHFRMATQGSVSMANQHPFLVLDKATDGIDLFMVHNGMLDGFDDPWSDESLYNYDGNKYTPGSGWGSTCASESDTAMMVNRVIKPILEKSPELIYEESFKELLMWRIGANDKHAYPNKLVFMDGFGQVIIINENAGTWQNGMWLSNLNSMYRKPVVYKTSTTLGYAPNTVASGTNSTTNASRTLTKAERRAARRAAKKAAANSAVTTAVAKSTTAEEVGQLFCTAGQASKQAEKAITSAWKVDSHGVAYKEAEAAGDFDGPDYDEGEDAYEGVDRYVGYGYGSSSINKEEVSLDWVIRSSYEDILDRTVENPEEIADFLVNLVFSSSV